MLKLDWIRARAGNWLDPNNTDWTTVDDAFGVYIIWMPTGGLASRLVVRVGQGRVADRVRNHIRDPEIGVFHPLKFTFAHVDPWCVDGVESYLGKRLSPLVGERFPYVNSIEVNLPDFDLEPRPATRNSFIGFAPTRHL